MTTTMAAPYSPESANIEDGGDDLIPLALALAERDREALASLVDAMLQAQDSQTTECGKCDCIVRSAKVKVRDQVRTVWLDAVSLRSHRCPR